MVSEIAFVMRDRFERENLSLLIPQAFDQLKSEDANFEMVTSNLLQPLTLFYADKIITHSHGVIFLQTHCKGLEYADAAKSAK